MIQQCVWEGGRLTAIFKSTGDARIGCFPPPLLVCQTPRDQGQRAWWGFGREAHVGRLHGDPELIGKTIDTVLNNKIMIREM